MKKTALRAGALALFVVMSAEGYEKFRDELKPKGKLIYESNLVQAEIKKGQPSFGIPSTRIAPWSGS